MNNIKKSFYYSFGILLPMQVSLTNAALDIKSTTTSQDDLEGNTGNDMIVVIENFIGWLVGMLYFVALVYFLYGGFQILTAGGEEDKVKKGKNTIIRGIIGLVVIFLASNVINWVISLFSGDGFTTSTSTN